MRNVGVIRICLLFCVRYALDTETLELDDDASAAAANFQVLVHSLARAGGLEDGQA
ncbi:MAG: hypothetical protein Q618_VCMC00001G0763 [Varibaculum cambriense DORA_20]|nr:MAG: hypothetical protein Q618_VCMC00001G0763 [Varibaculum cambriense DORA_20]